LNGATPQGIPPEIFHISKKRDDRMLVEQHENMQQ
jgi:hypothetical protein